ncbi:MAG: phosphopentomutase [Erysipelotrichaceae bacterium]
MNKYTRIILIVLDSLGVGASKDAYKFNDEGANTFLHIYEQYPKLQIPNLTKLGWFKNLSILPNQPSIEPLGYYSILSELSASKDTLCGHYEMMGLISDKPFQTFSIDGFPNELIDELEKLTGYKFIGNIACSGTEIIKEYGERIIKKDSNELIIYTSDDSVLQIAANVEHTPLKELYRVCEIARLITMKDEWKVARVIARPFIGTNTKNFIRTSDRKDYALDPPNNTLLDIMNNKGLSTIGIGKIGDIFNYKGIGSSIHTTSNSDGMAKLREQMKADFNGLCFVNLVDFDAKWGHRRNVEGYAKEIEVFDQDLGKLLSDLRQDDLLIITADHGNDPTYRGFNHTREVVPLIMYAKNLVASGKLCDGVGFSCVAKTIAENYDIKENYQGVSYLKQLK